MPLRSTVLVSAYSLGLDGSQRQLKADATAVLEEEAPRSSVVATPPVEEVVEALPDGPPEDDEKEPPSRPLARIAIARMSAIPLAATTEARGVELMLTGVPESHVTIQLLDGTVLHEGPTDADGKLAVRVAVPRGHSEIRAMLETGSTHRTALVSIAENDRTEFAFR